MTEHKLRKALQAAYEAHKDDFEQPWLSLAAEALAAPSGEQVELTDAELEAGRHKVFSTSNPFCPCDSKTFRKAARWAIAAHEAKRNGGAA